jgi:hypothetical protein
LSAAANREVFDFLNTDPDGLTAEEVATEMVSGHIRALAADDLY